MAAVQCGGSGLHLRAFLLMPSSDNRPTIDMLQYALVTAGLSDGLPRQELLAHLGLTKEQWEVGRRHWDDALLDSLLDTPAMQRQLDKLQAEARTTWQRRIDPIEEELDAWVAFEQHLHAAADIGAWLELRAVTIAEWLRVARKWRQRFVDDAQLRQRREELGAQSWPLPALTLTPRPTLAPAPAGVDETDNRLAALELDAAHEPPPSEPMLFAPLPARLVRKPAAKRKALGVGGIDTTGPLPALDPSAVAVVPFASTAAAAPKKSATPTPTAPASTPPMLVSTSVNDDASPWTDPAAAGAIGKPEDRKPAIEQTGMLPALAIEPAVPFAGRRTDPPPSVATSLPAASDIDKTGMLDAALFAQSASPFDETEPLDDMFQQSLAYLDDDRERGEPSRPRVPEGRDTVEPTASLEQLSAAAVAKALQPKKAKTGTVAMGPTVVAPPPSAAVAGSPSQHVEASLAGLAVVARGASKKRFILPVFAAMVTSVERADAEGRRDDALARLGLTEAEWSGLQTQLTEVLNTPALRLAWSTQLQQLAGTGGRSV